MSAFTDAFKRGTQGMEAISLGTCPGCYECADVFGFDLDAPDGRAAFSEAWSRGDCETGDEPSFSWRPCGICQTSLGGNRYAWHWIDPNDPTHAINHEHDMCGDCLIYLANGDEPEEWRES